MARDAIKILKERSRALAQKADPPAFTGTSLTLFTRAGQLFGIRTEEVDGAGRLRTLSQVPASPPWILGAVQRHGSVLTLVDLPVFWGLEPKGIADLPTYLVLVHGERRIGVMVEELQGVFELEGNPVIYRGPERSGIVQVVRRRSTPERLDEPILVVSALTLFQDPRLRP